MFLFIIFKHDLVLIDVMLVIYAALSSGYVNLIIIIT